MKLKNFPALAILALGLLASCNNDDDMEPGFEPTGKKTTYTLFSRAVPGISGDVEFAENDDNSTTITIRLNNTPAGGAHPAHIHFNTAAEGGDVALTLGTVDGDTGDGQITVSALNDGTVVTYDDLIEYDGYVNVHLSSAELGTIVAQGDIGINELTGEAKSYDLGSSAVPDISGAILFEERVSGEALATIELENTLQGGAHPAHIHFNSAAEGGNIAFTFNPVSGDDGISRTNVAQLDDGSAFGYDDVLQYDGYINVHLSQTELATIVAQGDIGINELTGELKSYNLSSVAVPDISGSVTFEERISGEALATLSLENTPEGGSHPAHIHFNTAADGGGIALTFNPVDGTTGMSKTHIAALNDGSPFQYADVLDYDGYINVHLASDQLATIVAQGDIGQNELTGLSTSYTLNSKAIAGIEGEAVFYERANGEALAVLNLVNTPTDGVHPAHIHFNSAAEGGNVAFSFNPLNGNTGESKTNVSALDDQTEFLYSDVLQFDGYINVHLSAQELGTIVAQGDIGANAL
jgi:Cu/Zn superoxide dismutase